MLPCPSPILGGLFSTLFCHHYITETNSLDDTMKYTSRRERSLLVHQLVARTRAKRQDSSAETVSGGQAKQ